MQSVLFVASVNVLELINIEQKQKQKQKQEQTSQTRIYITKENAATKLITLFLVRMRPVKMLN